jgi:hypothetical protein
MQEEWAEEWRAELATVITMPVTASVFARGLRVSAAQFVLPCGRSRPNAGRLRFAFLRPRLDHRQLSLRHADPQILLAAFATELAAWVVLHLPPREVASTLGFVLLILTVRLFIAMTRRSPHDLDP